MCIVCGSGSAHLLRGIARRHAPRPRLSADAVAPPIVPPLDPADDADLAGPADVILRGGPIITMNAAAPDADAIALRVGRIQAVGRAADVLAHRGRLTRIIDLDGRALLPGFVNAHWHMPFTLLCEWVDVRAAASPDAVLRALQRPTRQAPPGEWIVLGADAGIAAAMPGWGGALDAAAPSHPVLLTDPAGAIVAANGAAAAGGAVPAHVSALLPRFAVSPGPVRRRLIALLQQTAAMGVTCLRVCGLGTLAGTDDLDLMRAAMADAPPLRLRATLDAALLPEWKALRLSPGFGDDLFRVDTLSAWPGDEAEGLAAFLRAGREAGWHVTAHVADAARMPRVLDGFAAAGAGGDPRNGIECRRLPEPPQLAAMQRLGLSLGLTASEHEAAPAMGELPALPVSLGLDAATGPSAPLRMVQDARRAGLTLARSLAAVTLDAARRCGVGDILGSLQRGKYADLVFLDRDPRMTADAEFASLRCCATWMNGLEAFRG